MEATEIHEHEPQPAPGTPARHTVKRLVPDASDVEPEHTHVVGLETVDAGDSRRWNLVEFVRAIRAGDRFYLSEGSATIEVQPTVCDRCFRVTIATVSPGDA